MPPNAAPEPTLDPRLPHRFPFRLVEAQAGDRVVVSLTGGAWWSRGGELPASLAIEMLAQAAALLVPPPASPGDSAAGSPKAGTIPGYLAGLEDVELLAPLCPGDQLVAEVVLERRFGALLKVRALLRRGQEVVARGGLLLGTGELLPGQTPKA